MSVAFWALMAVGLALRLYLAWWGPLSYADFDMRSYGIVQEIVRHGGNVYAETERYNYSPVWSWILGALGLVQRGAGLGPHGVICTFLTGVDVATAYALFQLARRYGLPARTAALAFFLNPVSILITGHHGQFDNLAALFLVLMLLARTPAGSWGAAATAIAVKQIVLFTPLYGLAGAFPNRLARVLAWGTAALPFFLLLVPYWAGGAAGIKANVLGYSSNPDIWGLSYWLGTTTLGRWLTPDQVIIGSKGLLFGGFFLGAALLPKRVDPARAALLAPLIFLVLTPGYGAQYLVLPIALGALRPSFCYWLYTALAGLQCAVGYGFMKVPYAPLVHLQVVWAVALVWLGVAAARTFVLGRWVAWAGLAGLLALVGLEFWLLVEPGLVGRSLAEAPALQLGGALDPVRRALQLQWLAVAFDLALLGLAFRFYLRLGPATAFLLAAVLAFSPSFLDAAVQVSAYVPLACLVTLTGLAGWALVAAVVAWLWAPSFVILFLPLALVPLWRGLVGLLARLGVVGQERQGRLLVGILVAALLVRTSDLTRYAAAVSKHDQPRQAYGLVFQAIEQHVPRDATLISPRSAMVAFYTGRRTLPFPGQQPDELLKALPGAQYLVATPDIQRRRDLTRETVVALDRQVPGLLELVYVNEKGDYALFKVRPEKLR